MTGLATGLRLGMDLARNKDYEQDKQRQRDFQDAQFSMQQDQHNWQKQAHQQRLDTAQWERSLREDLLKRQHSKDELEALYQLGRIQDVISSNLPKDKKSDYLSRIPAYMNTLHGKQMNAEGPADLEQEFADVDETEDGLVWTLKNTDKQTGETYLAPMTWGRTRGGKDVAVQPWEMVSAQIRAYRDVATEMGIYDPNVMKDISGIAIGKDPQADIKYGGITKDPSSGLYGQYGNDGKFSALPGQKVGGGPGGGDAPAQIKTVEWVVNNIPGADGKPMSRREAWEFVQQAKSDRRGFIADMINKELQSIQIGMAGEEAKQAYQDDREAVENELVKKYDRLWGQIAGAPTSQAKSIQQEFPSAGQYKGQAIRDKQTGIIYRSNGETWEEVKR